jgi:parallel beta-helix repeat protein
MFAIPRFSRKKKSQNIFPRKSRNSFVPRLEALEGRDLPSTYTVVNTSPDPQVSGSLPWAVAQANGQSYANANASSIIDFDIPGAGTHVITLQQLPDNGNDGQLWLNGKVFIDGTSQPGYAGTPLISVQGAGSSIAGIFILNAAGAGSSSGSTIQGLDIYSYALHGITINPVSQGNFIQNNWIGFYQDASGVHRDTDIAGINPNNTIGITMQSSSNVIHDNCISGNYNAVAIGYDIFSPWNGVVSQSNNIYQNFIGTDPTGSTASGYGNLSNGVFFGEGAQNNSLGPNNVVSGNGTNAIELMHSTVTGNVVFQNKIGTDSTGKVSIANGWATVGGGVGILLGNGANGNAIGGPEGGNIVSGNGSCGISLGYAGPGGDDGPANNNFVQNNIVGLNSAQTGVVGSQHTGILLVDGSTSNVVSGNVVAGNKGSGIVISNSQQNYIEDNYIGESALGKPFANRGWGIELDAGATNNALVGNVFGRNRKGSIS